MGAGRTVVFLAVAGGILLGCTGLLGLDLDGKHGLAGAPSDASTDRSEGDPASPFTITQAVLGGSTLNAVWGADRDHVVAVGDSSVVYIHEPGVPGGWTRSGGNEPGRDLNGVWGRSARDVFAVGAIRSGGGFVRHYDGSSWTDVFSAPAALYGVWGTPDGFVIAVGARGGLYAWHAGQEWHSFGPLTPNPAVAGPEDPIGWGVAGRNFDDFGVAAGKGRVFHSEVQNGQQGLIAYDTLFDPGLSFRAVWQAPVAATNLFFATNYFGIVSLAVSGALPDASGRVTYDARLIFRDESTPNAANLFLYGLWGTPSTVVAVGDEGRIYALDLGTGDTTRVASPTTAALGSVWGSSLEDVWVVGEGEVILHGSLAH